MSRYRPALLSLALVLGCGSAEPSPRPAAIAPSVVASPAPAASSAPAVPQGPIEISIVGTNDLHGRIGALPLLGGYLDALRAARPGRVVLLDAGDMFQGTLESNPVEGAPVVEAYKKLGYAAVAIGNHEFDYGPVGEAAVVRRRPDGSRGEGDPRGALKARAAQAEGAFPVLAANITEGGRPLAWPNVKPSVLLTLAGGVRVGVIGVTTMGTPRTTIAANFEGLEVTPIAAAIQREAAALRAQGADIIAVAAHAGGDCKRLEDPDDLSSCNPDEEIFEVARALPQGTAHVIVAGHTHKAVAHKVAGIAIIESHATGKAFGRVDITWDRAARRVTAVRVHPPLSLEPGATYEGVTVRPSPAIADLLAPAVEAARARRSELLGVTLEQPITLSYHQESALGNMIVNLMLELDPSADVALTNGGGLRADLPAGPLTYGSLYDAFPFDNRLARVTMTGKALADLFRKNLSGSRGILSVAGLRVEARCGDKGLEVARLVRVNRRGIAGKPVKDDDRLVVVTSDFLATGGDDFGPQDKIAIDEGEPPYRDRVADLLRKRGGALRPGDFLRPNAPRIQLPAGGRPFCKT